MPDRGTVGASCLNMPNHTRDDEHTMSIALVLAIVLALVFVIAAGSKLTSLEETATGFDELGVPIPSVSVWLVIFLEAAIAVSLVVAPSWGSLAAFATLAGFTVFLAGLVRSGRPVACRCFGGSTTEAISNTTLVRNGVLLVLAAAVALLS